MVGGSKNNIYFKGFHKCDLKETSLRTATITGIRPVSKYNFSVYDKYSLYSKVKPVEKHVIFSIKKGNKTS